MDCLGSGLRLAAGRANWCLLHPSSDEGAPEQEVPAEQGKEEPREPEPPLNGTWGGCWWMPHVPLPLSSQDTCARCYRGQLASIHSSLINQRLSCMVRTRTNRSQVWIGGYTSGWHHCLRAYWVDRSSWNYSNWARGNPCRTGKTCVAMCPSGQRWGSIHCLREQECPCPVACSAGCSRGRATPLAAS
uniref:C-type lectin domain-containing protein n=1 Tax=Chrysemys picta bellii TaxID=8478 RepID=A0A8C3FG17_CHRPI